MFLISLSLSRCLCLCLSVSLSLSFCLCLSPSLCLSVSLCVYVCLSVSPPLCLCLSLFLSVCLSLCLPLSLSLCFSLCVCLSVSLFSVTLYFSLLVRVCRDEPLPGKEGMVYISDVDYRVAQWSNIVRSKESGFVLDFHDDRNLGYVGRRALNVLPAFSHAWSWFEEGPP